MINYLILYELTQPPYKDLHWEYPKDFETLYSFNNMNELVVLHSLLKDEDEVDDVE